MLRPLRQQVCSLMPSVSLQRPVPVRRVGSDTQEAKSGTFDFVWDANISKFTKMTRGCCGEIMSCFVVLAWL